MKNLIFEKKAISSKTVLKKIKKDLQNLDLSYGKIDVGSSKEKTDFKVRKYLVSLFTTHPELDLLAQKICFKLENYFHHESLKVLQYQYGLYKKDDFYDWHKDYFKKGGTSSRRFTVVLFLSNNKSYSGGFLEISDPTHNKIFKFKPAPGTIIAFPSVLLHRVSPVKKGTRETLTFWLGARQ